MAKQPIAGQTKTRLYPILTPQQAADLYRCFLLDKMTTMCQVHGVQVAIGYYPSESRPYFAQLAPNFVLLEQQGANLSERLRHIFRTAFEQGYTQVAAIDGDSVTLPAAYLQMLFTALEEVDVSLGPCEDGGYYGIGMKAPHLTLLDVTMSTPLVVRDTLAQAEQAHLTVKLLPEWYDIDTPTDLNRVSAVLDPTTHTAQFLKAGQR